jgi:hypothetical protein
MTPNLLGTIHEYIQNRQAAEDPQNKSTMTIEPDAPPKSKTQIVTPNRNNPSGYPVETPGHHVEKT